ncbi:MAG TPA: phosphomannomutase, partial [Sorangium sp.]|nr:phosphomannomutase [Sorangium sp.]
MKVPRHIFREYDIRGVAERDLTSELARELGAAFALLLARELGAGPTPGGARPRVAVCRDGRLSRS